MIDDITRFVVLVDTLSFTKAAEQLHMTQPALSISVKRLEKAIGAQLLHHTNKQVTLTSEGKLTYETAKHIVAVWENLTNKSFRNTMLGKKLYRIGMFDNAALILAPFFEKMIGENRYMLETTIDSSANLLKHMQLGLLDLCISVVSKKNPLSGHMIHVYTEDLLPVSAKQWETKNLSALPLIVYNQSSTTREYIDKAFLNNATKQNIIAQSTSVSFMKELALLGKGIAFLPKNIVARELKEKTLYSTPLPFTITRTIGVFVSLTGNIKEEKELLQDLLTFLPQPL
jgi:DNA-binding transcriptional LysR family regulator